MILKMDLQTTTNLLHALQELKRTLQTQSLCGSQNSYQEVKGKLLLSLLV